MFVSKDQKGQLLEQLLSGNDIERAIVFTRTKHGADKLSRRLEKAGFEAPAIHGNKSQNARERALAGFKQGKTRVLVATDIAARGIDVDGVFARHQFRPAQRARELRAPDRPHGRAGATGRAISFCDREERPFLADIERLIRQRLQVLDVKLGPAPAPAPADRAMSSERRVPPRARDALGAQSSAKARRAPRTGPAWGLTPAHGQSQRGSAPARPEPRGTPGACPEPRPAARPALPTARRDAGAPQRDEAPAGQPWWQNGPQRGTFEGQSS